MTMRYLFGHANGVSGPGWCPFQLACCTPPQRKSEPGGQRPMTTHGNSKQGRAFRFAATLNEPPWSTRGWRYFGTWSLAWIIVVALGWTLAHYVSRTAGVKQSAAATARIAAVLRPNSQDAILAVLAKLDRTVLLLARSPSLKGLAVEACFHADGAGVSVHRRVLNVRHPGELGWRRGGPQPRS
jgi:hypothetical protein